MSGPGQARRRRRRLETPYSRIVEVREASTQDSANDLLRQGFILVKVSQRYAAEGEKQAGGIVYVLGRQKSNGHRSAAPEGDGRAPSNQPAAPAIDTAALEGLPWKKYSNGGGEWAFYMDRDESLLPELQGVSDTIERLKAGGEVTAGGYTYRIKDKFLKRFQARAAQ